MRCSKCDMNLCLCCYNKDRVILDADHQGELISICTDYHTHLENKLKDSLYELYLVGNIQGRLLTEHVSVRDVEIIEDWQEILKEVNDETIRNNTE